MTLDAKVHFFDFKEYILQDWSWRNADGSMCVNEGQMCLYRLCRETRAERTMESGCAYVFSTLYFLAAISSNLTATHTAIDPYENNGWASWR